MSDASTPSRISEIPRDQLSAQQRDIMNRLLRDRGRVPTPFKIWLHSSTLADHLEGLGEFLTSRSTLTPREAKIVILWMAVHWHADYVFKVHAREARVLGLAENVIEAIGAGRSPPLKSSREQIVYELVRQSAVLEPASDDLFESAIEELGHAGVAELLATCGYFTAVALATKLYRVKIPPIRSEL